MPRYDKLRMKPESAGEGNRAARDFHPCLDDAKWGGRGPGLVCEDLEFSPEGGVVLLVVSMGFQSGLLVELEVVV